MSSAPNSRGSIGSPAEVQQRVRDWGVVAGVTEPVPICGFCGKPILPTHDMVVAKDVAHHYDCYDKKHRGERFGDKERSRLPRAS